MSFFAKPAVGGVAFFILLSTIPVLAGVLRFVWFASGEVSAETLRFADNPIPIALHAGAILIFAILGPFQFVARLRRGAWHRVSGRLVWFAGVVAAITGLWMTLAYQLPAKDQTIALYAARITVGIWMLYCLAQAILAIRQRAIARHRAFMIRAYAIGMGAGTQALIGIVPFAVIDAPSPAFNAVVMLAGWIVNAVAAELILARDKGFGRTLTPQTP